MCGQIQGSAWYKADKHFKIQGNATLDSSMPLFEEFVFAAVYIRQFFMKRDKVLHDAVQRYCNHVKCPVRKSWMQNEVNSFDALVESTTAPFAIKEYTLRELFEAFIYGAGLLHKIPSESDSARKCFLDVYDNYPRAVLLGALNIQLTVLLNHVWNAGVIIQQDYSHWRSAHGLPLPDVRWHNRLFDAARE